MIGIALLFHDVLYGFLEVVFREEDLLARFGDHGAAALHVAAAAGTFILLEILATDGADLFKDVDHTVHGRDPDGRVTVVGKQIDLLATGIVLLRDDIHEEFSLLGDPETVLL